METDQCSLGTSSSFKSNNGWNQKLITPNVPLIEQSLKGIMLPHRVDYTLSAHLYTEGRSVFIHLWFIDNRRSVKEKYKDGEWFIADH